MKNVALLAPYFLPRRRVGSWRPFKFAIHLQDFGWKPHIITIRDSQGSLTKKEAQLLADIPVFEIKTPFDFTHKIGRQLEFNGQFIPRKDTRSPDTKNRLKPILSWVDRHFPIDTWLPLLYLRQNKVEEYIESINPQLLWSTGDPWSSHWLAHKLAEKYGLPWVADFRDPWTLGDVNLKERSDFSRQIDRRQEQKIVRNASHLTFTSSHTEKLYAEWYNADMPKSDTITNSFDSVLFKPKETDQQYFEDEHLNLIFFGKFRPLSPAEPFINILYELKSSFPEISKKIRMHSFGSLSREERALAEEKGVADNFVTFKPIALENALPVLTQADILWLSTHPSREHIIPAKLWDYLAARRPILSIAPNPEIKTIIQQTGSGIHLDSGETAKAVEILQKAVVAKRQSAEMPISTAFDEEAIKQYDSEITTRKLANIFDRLTMIHG